MHLKFNSSSCTGCQLCQLACSARHEGRFDPYRSRIRVSSEYGPQGLEVSGRVCDLCGGDPRCVQICPTAAITLTETGLVLDEGECIVCLVCVAECPAGAIRETEDAKVALCDLCAGDPQCVSWCPHGAVALEVKA